MEDLPIGKSSVGILGVCRDGDDHDHGDGRYNDENAEAGCHGVDDADIGGVGDLAYA